MQPKNKFSFKKFSEDLVMFICLSLFSLGIFVYSQNIPLRYFLFPQLKNSSFEKIANIEEVNGLVERKKNNSSIYEQGNLNLDLYEFDTIKTGENSKAIIKFHDGSRVVISENSIMVLEVNPKFSFNQGLYRSPKVKVIKGMANSNKIAVVVNKPKTKKVKPKREIASRPNIVKKVAKKEELFGLKVNTPEKISGGVVLSWDKFQKNTKYTVQIFKSKNSDPFLKKVVYGSSLKYNNQELLDRGFYYKVSTETSKNVISSHKYFYAERYAPPTYLEPKNNKEFSLKNITGNKIILSWEKIPSNSYMVEISGDSEFKRVKRFPASTNFMVLKPTKKSKYYWRVVPLTKDGRKGIPSKTHLLKIK